jgi:hypothetical protein
LALVLLVAGCSSNGSTESAFSGAPAQVAPGLDTGSAKGNAGTAQDSAGVAKTDAGSAAQNRQLVRTAQVDLRAEDVPAAFGKVKDLAQREGGYVGQESSGESGGSLTLRVPGDRLDAVLKGIGEVERTSVTRREVRSEDVTEQVVDVEARLATQRASVDRVRALLERAATTSEITQIEGELTKRQTELESLQRRYDSLKGQVALSTITVSIGRTSGPAPVAEEMGFLGALASGWHALLGALRVVVVVIGAVLPFAVLLGVVGAVYWVLRRKRRAIPTPSPAESTN